MIENQLWFILRGYIQKQMGTAYQNQVGKKNLLTIYTHAWFS